MIFFKIISLILSTKTFAQCCYENVKKRHFYLLFSLTDETKINDYTSNCFCKNDRKRIRTYDNFIKQLLIVLGVSRSMSTNQIVF